MTSRIHSASMTAFAAALALASVTVGCIPTDDEGDLELPGTFSGGRPIGTITVTLGQESGSDSATGTGTGSESTTAGEFGEDSSSDEDRADDAEDSESSDEASSSSSSSSSDDSTGTTSSATTSDGSTSGTSTGESSSTESSSDSTGTESDTTTSESTTTETSEASEESTSGTETTTDSSSETEAESSGESTGDTDSVEPNCGLVVCSGHKSCRENAAGEMACNCDAGFLDDGAGGCVYDTNCVRVDTLESSCRQEINGSPSIGFTFVPKYCNGAPLTPEIMEGVSGSADGSTWFVIKDDTTVDEYALVEHKPELLVPIVLDATDAFLAGGDLADVAMELSDLASVVSDASVASETTLYMALYIFGSNVVEQVPFTRDISKITAALDAVALDPGAANAAAGHDASLLFEATERAILDVQRMHHFRTAVTDGGVVSVSGMLVVTGGGNSSSDSANTTLLNTTNTSVYAVGVGPNIIDDDISVVGVDASILAPAKVDRDQAFTEIAQNIANLPRASYFVGYCSTQTSRTRAASVEIWVDGLKISLGTASCGYSADVFSGLDSDSCTLDMFANEAAQLCEARACGGMGACGACADSECCAPDGTCGSPTGQTKEPCDDDYNLCVNAGESCIEDVCITSIELGQACASPYACERGVAYCGPGDICTATLPEGSGCEESVECASAVCAKHKANNPFSPLVCKPGEPGSRMYRSCESDAECEMGTYCLNKACQPRKLDYLDGTCVRTGMCHFGECAGARCGGSACFFDWSSKLD